MLDPTHWQQFRKTAHAMLDDALDGLAKISEGPVWQEVPQECKARLADMPLPRDGMALDALYAEYRELIEPYAVGNRHARFFGWVHGNGTPSGMLAEMLTAGLNVNAGGREQAAPYVERAVIAWWVEVFGFPSDSSGIVTSGTSVATLCALSLARYRALGGDVRTRGNAARAIVGYASTSVHHCAVDAFEMLGLGSESLRRIETDAHGRLDIERLEAAVKADKASGQLPFVLIATSGSVDTGACDDLTSAADCAGRNGLWLHVDGAFGALAKLAPMRAHLVAGIERADSLAFDFHKWMHVPYGAGLMLTRHRAIHLANFSDDAAYLRKKKVGTAGGEPWFCDLGPELSRRFRALGVWFAMREFGLTRIGEAIEANCRLASYLAERVAMIPDFMVMHPVQLQIACVRFAPPEFDAITLDALNDAIAIRLQTSGVAVPSTTSIQGQVVLRFNITNHRTTQADIDLTLAALAEAAQSLRVEYAVAGGTGNLLP